MRFGEAVKLCAMWLALSSSLDAQPRDAILAAEAVQRAWLDYEIGRFVDGRLRVFSGKATVRQQDAEEIVFVEGAVLATLSPHPPYPLTVLFPERGLWLRLTQDPASPGFTEVTRLRTFDGNAGRLARCSDCAVSLADHDSDSLFLRLSAEGVLLDVGRSRFRVEIAAQFQRLAPGTLDLDQVLQLNPGIEAWRARPEGRFRMRDRTAFRNVRATLSQSAPAPGGDTARYTCTLNTPYSAQHVVTLGDLRRFAVRNIRLGTAVRCCVDHALHDGASMCDREGSQ